MKMRFGGERRRATALRQSSLEKRGVTPDPTIIDFETATPEQYRAYIEAQRNRGVGFEQDTDRIEGIAANIEEARQEFQKRFPGESL